MNDDVPVEPDEEWNPYDEPAFPWAQLAAFIREHNPGLIPYLRRKYGSPSGEAWRQAHGHGYSEGGALRVGQRLDRDDD